MYHDTGCPKKYIVFRNVAVFLLRGVRAVKIWVFCGAEHIYAITRCLVNVPNVSTLVWTPISPLYTSEWPLIKSFAIFLRRFFLGHPVVVSNTDGWVYFNEANRYYKALRGDGTSWNYTNWANGRPNAGTRHSSYNAIVLTYHESWSSVVWCARLLILYILHRSLSMWIWSTYALNCNTAAQYCQYTAMIYSSKTFFFIISIYFIFALVSWHNNIWMGRNKYY